MKKIKIIDQSSTFACEAIKVAPGEFRIWIVETDRLESGHIWFPTFSKFCKHEVLAGECINCGLVIEGDE